MQIYFLPITDPIMNDRDLELLPFASPVRRERIAKYRSPLDQKLSLYAECITRIGLSRATHTPAAVLEFQYVERHKPTAVTTSTYDFSYSHTHSAILCAITGKGKIGADIEEIKKAPLNVMRRVFHSKEIEYVQNSSPALIDRHFFEIWTRKEAYTKYLGTGLATELTSINTLSSDLLSGFYTWQQNQYICSVYSDNLLFSKPLVLTEEEVWEAILHSQSLPSQP